MTKLTLNFAFVKYRESAESFWTSEAALSFCVLLQERKSVKEFGRSAAWSLGCGAPKRGSGIAYYTNSHRSSLLQRSSPQRSLPTFDLFGVLSLWRALLRSNIRFE
jgi:hypothetical protein